MSVVAGFTTMDIHAAADEAGDGGDVYFPAGEYASDGLQVTHPRQTWNLQREAVIKKATGSTASSVVQVLADGWRLRGGTLDGNRAYDTAQYQSGVICESHSLDMRDFTLRGVRDWGVYQFDGEMTLIDFCIKEVGLSGIYWYLTAASATTKGPHIERGTIDHVIGFVDLGCVAIIGHAVKRGVVPRIINVTMLSHNPGGPPSTNDSGGLAVFNCDQAQVSGCDTAGGRMGMSFSNSHACAISTHTARQHTSYELELVNCNGTAVNGNSYRGAAGVTGIENNHSNSTKVSGNAISGCTPFLRIYQSTGVQHDMLAANVLVQ